MKYTTLFFILHSIFSCDYIIHYYKRYTSHNESYDILQRYFENIDDSEIYTII